MFAFATEGHKYKILLANGLTIIGTIVKEMGDEILVSIEKLEEPWADYDVDAMAIQSRYVVGYAKLDDD